jgi:hypothetical protein
MPCYYDNKRFIKIQSVEVFHVMFLSFAVTFFNKMNSHNRTEAEVKFSSQTIFWRR